MSKLVGLVFEETKEQQERVQCPYCEKTYASQEKLVSHIRVKHPEQQA